MARRKRNSSPTRAAPWFTAGLVSGLALATVFILISKDGPDVITDSPTADTETGEPLLSQTGETANNPPQRERPRYDFFTVLPEMEVVVPEEEISARAEAAPDPSVDTMDNYILQAGSFQNSTDADGLKAQLALLGVVANVQSVEVNGDTWHRVRVGPLASAREANDVRRQLQDNGYDAMVLKDG